MASYTKEQFMQMGAKPVQPQAQRKVGGGGRSFTKEQLMELGARPISQQKPQLDNGITPKEQEMIDKEAIAEMSPIRRALRKASSFAGVKGTWVESPSEAMREIAMDTDVGSNLEMQARVTGKAISEVAKSAPRIIGTGAAFPARGILGAATAMGLGETGASLIEGKGVKGSLGRGGMSAGLTALGGIIGEKIAPAIPNVVSSIGGTLKRFNPIPITKTKAQWMEKVGKEVQGASDEITSYFYDNANKILKMKPDDAVKINENELIRNITAGVVRLKDRYGSRMGKMLERAGDETTDLSPVYDDLVNASNNLSPILGRDSTALKRINDFGMKIAERNGKFTNKEVAKISKEINELAQGSKNFEVSGALQGIKEKVLGQVNNPAYKVARKKYARLADLTDSVFGKNFFGDLTLLKNKVKALDNKELTDEIISSLGSTFVRKEKPVSQALGQLGAETGGTLQRSAFGGDTRMAAFKELEKLLPGSSKVLDKVMQKKAYNVFIKELQKQGGSRADLINTFRKEILKNFRPEDAGEVVSRAPSKIATMAGKAVGATAKAIKRGGEAITPALQRGFSIESSRAFDL